MREREELIRARVAIVSIALSARFAGNNRISNPLSMVA